MSTLPPPVSFARPLPAAQARVLPPATVLAGSAMTALPMVAPAAFLPPFGLLMLVAWRLLAPQSLRLWAPALLGFADDLVSGQPLGSAVLLWTATFLLIELVDQRLVFRDWWQDWSLAAVAIAACLVAGRFLAVPLGAHVDPMLMVQIVVAILAFPATARLCSWLDRKRRAA